MLVCKAILKVIAHKEITAMRGEYPYLEDLEKVTNRVLVKYE